LAGEEGLVILKSSDPESVLGWEHCVTSEVGPAGPLATLESKTLPTERSTLAFPRSCHNAWADLLRKQQVVGEAGPEVEAPPIEKAVIVRPRASTSGV
jgi:hypothetical protein